MKWRDKENVIAHIFEKGEKRSIRTHDIVIRPNEALVIIEDGKVDDILTQTRLKDMAGGIRNWMARKAKIGKDILFLFVDTRPFEIEADILGSSRDYIEIGGKVTILFEIKLNDAHKLLNFMKEYLSPKTKTKGILRKREVFDGYETEGRTLTKEMVRDRIVKELNAKVFTPVMSRYDAADYRNVKVMKDMQMEATVQLRKTFDLWGLKLPNLYVNFQQSDYDTSRKYAAKKRLQADMLDADFHGEIRDVERLGELQKVQVIGEEEVQDIRHGKQLDRHKQERMQDLELDHMETANDMEVLKQMVALQREMTDQRIHEYSETSHKARELDAEKDIELARIDSEKAKHDLNTFKDAQSRERDNHIDTMELYSRIMGGTAGGSERAGSGSEKLGRSGEAGIERRGAEAGKERLWEKGDRKDAEDENAGWQVKGEEIGSQRGGRKVMGVNKRILQVHRDVTSTIEDRYCSHCGRYLERGWTTCPHCQTRQ